MSKEINYKKKLEELTRAVVGVLGALDVEMKKPSSYERGKRIAKICNALEMENDRKMYFDLGWSWEKIKKLKKIQEKVKGIS